MCGIVGVFGAINGDWVSTFRDLLFVDQMRGMDSTGVMVSTSTGRSKIHKVVGGVTEWEDSLLLEGVTQQYTLGFGTSSVLLLGHNRKATMGAVTVENAHPHHVKSIIGVHNGTLHWHSMNGFSAYKAQSDSLCLYTEIANKGIEHTYNKAQGAMALVWWDMSDQTLYMLRNNERPLWVYYDDAKSVMAWSSEKWMLEICAGRNKISLDTSASFTELPVDELHTFRFRPLRENGKLSYRKKKLTPSKEVSYVPPFEQRLPHKANSTPVSSGTFRDPFRKPTSSPSSEEGICIPFAAYCGPNKSHILATNWLHLMSKMDCAWCGSPMGGVSWVNDRYKVQWVSNREVVCPECASNTEVQQYLQGCY